ncbi:MAG: hypothetical protein GF383_14315 [Candidatus Lokiarchaeota archaeon]|nr:hypothetical protein [Candidatus Lokiarchaeota archaeon]MBD3342542.1 hypothetical protein [Candidatus Lokiarchaeota archaeon]
MSENEKEDLRYEIPTHAFIALARRGMEKISLDQCFLPDCDNEDPKLLEPFKKEEYEDKEKQVKKIYIKCKKCGGVYQLKLETVKRVAKPTKKGSSKDESEEKSLSMGLVHALDEDGKNLGHIGYF